MKKVLLFSLLLVGGLIASQTLPGLVGDAWWHTLSHWIHLGTISALAFIMIHVGFEFDIDKKNPGRYALDGAVAASAATLPWIFCSAYFIFAMAPSEFWTDATAWKESLLAGVFSAPTSAGVLFSMLAAAGLGATWLFKKARVLAIFDDLFVVLLMIPLKMMIVGFKWQLAVVVFIMGAQLLMAWRWLHVVRAPTRWPWVVGYALGIVVLTEAVGRASLIFDADTPIHIEVLLPAFVLGCMLARPGHQPKEPYNSGEDPDLALDPKHGYDDPSEARAATIISAIFMVLVGLSMPVIDMGDKAANAAEAAGRVAETISDGMQHLSELPSMGWGMIALHVLAVTVVSNIGKMLPALCYKQEASAKQRLALAVGMWPRGEVGAGVLVIALGYQISGPIVTVALLSLIANLILTGAFIIFIKKLLGDPADATPA